MGFVDAEGFRALDDGEAEAGAGEGSLEEVVVGIGEEADGEAGTGEQFDGVVGVRVGVSFAEAVAEFVGGAVRVATEAVLLEGGGELSAPDFPLGVPGR